jgi:hypothetical protein
MKVGVMGVIGGDADKGVGGKEA